MYVQFLRGEPFPHGEGNVLLPNREDFAVVYRFLRQYGGWDGPAMFLWYRMKQPQMHMGRLLFLLDVMEERKLILCKHHAGSLRAELMPVQGKVDLTASPLFKKLKGYLKKEGI